MHNTNKRPLWVHLAFSGISRRRTALWLTWGCALFTLYCLPWAELLPGPDWLARLFLVHDWSWFAMMVPMTGWYWLGLRWMDRHRAWATGG